MKEEWRDVVGLGERFQISNYGNLRSKKTKRILSTYLNQGYYQHATKVEGNPVIIKIHRAVAEAFIEIPEYLEEYHKTVYYGKLPVNHKDCNKTNNHVNNLEWCTYSENSQHAVENGLFRPQSGENNTNSKLTQDLIEQIRSRYIPKCRKNGARQLAREYNVHHTNILKAIKGISYNHRKIG